MNAEKNNEGYRSPESIQLAQDIRIIMSAPSKLDKIVNPPATDVWKKFIDDFLPRQKQFPDNVVIKQVLDEIAVCRDIKQNYPEGFDCCYTVIPCHPSGEEWSTQDLMQNLHIVRLIAPPEKKIDIPEHQKQQRLLWQFTPEEIKNECGFRISYDNNGKKLSPERLTVRIMTQSARSLLNLQRLLK